MSKRRSSTRSNNRIDDDDDDDDDDQLLVSAFSSFQENERSAVDILDEPLVGINLPDDRESDTEQLLDINQIQPSITNTFQCSNVPARYTIAIWAFFGFLFLYAMRVNLSVAIVAMVAPQSALNQSVQSCPASNRNSTGPKPKYEFEWSPTVEGVVLGAFFYGYITMQIIGGNIAEKFGAKWVVGGAALAAGLLTLLTPLAARTHVGLLIAVRFLTGLAASPVFPAAAALWGKWVPPSERSRLIPAAQSGSTIGTVLTAPLVSIMIEANFLGGWPSAFYVFGVSSCLWCVGWCFFGFSLPDEHPRISNEERRYLNKHISAHTHNHGKTPWKKILRCPSFYALVIMYLTVNYTYYTLLTSLPTYFATILNFNLHENGFLSALPYVVQFLFTIIVGQIVDRIRERNILSLTTIRKGQTVIGCLGSCSFLIGIGFMGCNYIGAVICCIFAVGFIGVHSCGALISHVDIASNYAGTLMGMTNTVATLSGFVGPYVVGAITNNNQTIEAWRLIFCISAGVGAFGGIAYCILYTGEEQPWNRTMEAQEEKKSIISID